MADKGFWGKLTSQSAPPDPGTLRWKGYQVVTRFNVLVYRASGGRIGGRFDGAPVCVLHHRGAKTGQPRETPLLYLPDDGRVILVASMGGRPNHPAWYHNLRAHPDIEIERGGRREPMKARVTEGEERAQLWEKMRRVWPNYDAYQAKTTRRIPVILCEPRSP